MAKTPTTPTDKTDETGMTIIRSASTMNLMQTANIQYEIARDDTDSIWLRLSAYEGNGYYCKAWVSLDKAIASLERFEKTQAITSFALKDVFPANTSSNSWGFLTAVLLAEGLLEPLEDNKRRYRLRTTTTFLDSLEKMKAKHGDPAQGKPRNKSKSAARMSKGRAKPATGK
ncbi:MAG: hypothetical protein H6989_06355 [Pseudomonadales bacterium]|nr:hypothetical protein [Pseudomonadales bacterium]